MPRERQVAVAEEQPRPMTAKVHFPRILFPLVPVFLIEISKPSTFQSCQHVMQVANVILDNDDANEDDGEEFLIEEAPKDPLMSMEAEPALEVTFNSIPLHVSPCQNAICEKSVTPLQVAAVEGGEQHGALVQQIIETQKELQDGNKRPAEGRKGVEIVS